MAQTMHMQLDHGNKTFLWQFRTAELHEATWSWNLPLIAVVSIKTVYVKLLRGNQYLHLETIPNEYLELY